MKEVIWEQAYRPKTLAECILPPRLREQFEGYVNKGFLPNVIFDGSAGIGKTTVARALAHELNLEYYELNGSLSGGIDTLRYEIQAFAETVSFSGNRKLVLIDEGDYLSQATQPALRNFMETFSANCSFIITCNYLDKILVELKSRMDVVDFNFQNGEESAIAKTFYLRLKEILAAEGVTEVDDAVLRQHLFERFPDMRNTILSLQGYVMRTGKVDVGLISNGIDYIVNDLIDIMKAKDYPKLRNWVGENSSRPYNQIYSLLYKKAYDFWTGSSVPMISIVLAKYLDMHARSVDHEITMAAALTEVMLEGKWK